MKSKEEDLLELFFNNPTRELHFEDILKEVKIARSKAGRWLKRFIKEGFIKRVKVGGRMPFYIGNYDSPSYMNRKKLFAFYKLYDCGFLDHLSSLPRAKTVILFGSFSRSDWYSDSDIDVFIYGDSEGLKLGKYESALHRDVQVFVCRNKKELAKFGEGFVRNIIKGSLIKGDLSFVRVGISA